MSLNRPGFVEARTHQSLHQTRGDSLRGLPVLGPAAGAAVRRGRRGGLRAPLQTPASQPARGRRGAGGADRPAPQGIDQAGTGRRLGHHPQPPGPPHPEVTAPLTAGPADAGPPDFTVIPATSTNWRILTRPGFITPQPQKRPRSSWRTFAAEQPNERWQADGTRGYQPPRRPLRARAGAGPRDEITSSHATVAAWTTVASSSPARRAPRSVPRTFTTSKRPTRPSPR